MIVSMQRSWRSFIDTTALADRQERVSGNFQIVIPALQTAGGG
jgi:hypothetical protein